MQPTSRSWWTWRSLCHDICSWVAKLFSKEEAGGVCTTVVLCNIRADRGEALVYRGIQKLATP